MNTEIAAPRKKVEDLVESMIPQAHRESAKLLQQENDQQREYISELEGRIKEVNQQYADTQTALEKRNKEFDDNQSKFQEVENKERDLKERENKISLRELELNHHDEINKMKVASAEKSESTVISMMRTVFSPPALRTEVHKSLPIRKHQTIMNTKYNDNGNSYTENDRDDDVIEQRGSTETKTETEE